MGEYKILSKYITKEKFSYIFKCHLASTTDFLYFTSRKGITDIKVLDKSISVEEVMLSYSEKIHAVVGEETSSFLSFPQNIKKYV